MLEAVARGRGGDHARHRGADPDRARPPGGPVAAARHRRDPDRLTERELDVLAPGRRRAAQQGDRRGARDLREHRQVPPAQHPGQAPRPEPRRGRRARGPRGTAPGRLTAPAWPGPASARADPARRHPPERDRPPPRPDGRGPAQAAAPDARHATRRRRMGYRIDIDQTRLHHVRHVHGRVPGRGARHDPAAAAGDRDRPRARAVRSPWTMERPLQVGECIGCGICIRECPPERDDRSSPWTATVPLARAPGPHRAAVAGLGRRRVAAPVRGHPRGAQAHARLAVGRPVHLEDPLAPEAVAGLDHDGRGRAADRRSPPARRPARPAPTPAATSAWWPPAGTTRRTPSPPRSTRSRRSAAGSAPPRARRPAAAASSTSRSRSARSSASPSSTASCPPSRRPPASAPRRSRSSAADRPACRPPGTSPASATRSPSSRRCRSPAA